MSDKNINNMDFKQLRNEVQLLRDELAIMKRKYEDIIYNLDDDNFSSRFVKEKGDMKTAIEITAEGIRTKVSKEDLDNKLSEYSTISQTSSAISTVVSKNISAKFESSVKPTKSNTTTAQKGMLCEYNDDLYYYNDVTNTWKIYPYADGIMSQFLQTASGFELTGDVSISGDAIVGGSITGSVLQNSYGSAKLYLGEDTGSWADLRLEDTLGNRVFYVYQDASIVHFKTYDNCFISTTDSKAIPQGIWDFSECTDVLGLDDFVVGGSGGVARFG